MALCRLQRLIEETTDLTAKMRLLDREIDGVLTEGDAGDLGREVCLKYERREK